MTTPGLRPINVEVPHLVTIPIPTAVEVRAQHHEVQLHSRRLRLGRRRLVVLGGGPARGHEGHAGGQAVRRSPVRLHGEPDCGGGGLDIESRPSCKVMQLKN